MGAGRSCAPDSVCDRGGGSSENDARLSGEFAGTHCDLRSRSAFSSIATIIAQLLLYIVDLEVRNATSAT